MDTNKADKQGWNQLKPKPKAKIPKVGKEIGPRQRNRLGHDKENQKVIYNSKRGRVVYNPLEWLAAITSHIPDKGAQNVHYYGAYSNKNRG